MAKRRGASSYRRNMTQSQANLVQDGFACAIVSAEGEMEACMSEC